MCCSLRARMRITICWSNTRPRNGAAERHAPSPEGFASILWKDGSRAQEAADVMHITAQDLKALGIIEDIIPEYGTADDDALTSIANYMKGNMKAFLKKRETMTEEELREERYGRFRKF